MIPIPILGALGAWEALWWAARRRRRTTLYDDALRRARAIGRPLIVVGAPDGGVTGGYGCGDVTVDLAPCRCCPNAVRADVCELLPFGDNSAVVFVSCVLEYVNDLDAAMREIDRVSGGERYIARVEPWTATAYAYPGARRTLPSGLLQRPELPRTRVSLTGLGGRATVDAELAYTPAAREYGLQWRYALPSQTGMLFVFEEPGLHPFWMRNTLVPLDIIFADQHGRVISIARGTVPLDDRTTYAAPGTKYALEVPAGFARTSGVFVGSVLSADGVTP